MNLVDFITGALLMNAMPHFIFGITGTKFLGLFGFSPKGNILYALVQFVACLVLFHANHDVRTILSNGIFTGGLTVLLLFFVFGKTILRFYNKK
ncbi:MAG TPA: hypothetical protein VK177_21600 [Flavobacteriales bacterium]|nr:hypothetical protein [Flavobacteriales bacterium]